MVCISYSRKNGTHKTKRNQLYNQIPQKKEKKESVATSKKTAKINYEVTPHKKRDETNQHQLSRVASGSQQRSKATWS